MIIVCPQCAKEYRVDPAELPPAKSSQYARSGKGWWLSCRYCFKEWWYPAPKGFGWYEGGTPPEQYAKTVVKKAAKFEDKTDLSALEKRAPSTSEEEQLHHEQLMHQQYTPYQLHVEEVMELQQPIKKLPIRSLMATLGVIVIALAGYFIKPFWIEDTAGYVNKAVKLETPEEQKYVLSLQIKDVKYDVETKSDKRIIKVMGVLTNTNDTCAKISPLKINVWGPCKPDALAQNITTPESPTPQCLIKSWEHSVKQETINKDQCISFETSTPIMLDTAIQKVDVTFLGN